MGWLDTVREIRRSISGIAPRSEQSLRGALLVLGSDPKPYVVRVCRPGDPDQLVAELKIVDAC